MNEYTGPERREDCVGDDSGVTGVYSSSGMTGN